MKRLLIMVLALAGLSATSFAQQVQPVKNTAAAAPVQHAMKPTHKHMAKKHKKTSTAMHHKKKMTHATAQKSSASAAKKAAPATAMKKNETKDKTLATNKKMTHSAKAEKNEKQTRKKDS